MFFWSGSVAYLLVFGSFPYYPGEAKPMQPCKARWFIVTRTSNLLKRRFPTQANAPAMKKAIIEAGVSDLDIYQPLYLQSRQFDGAST